VNTSRTLLVILSCCIGSSAMAQTQVEQQARSYSASGMAAYRQGRYDEALASFKRAYELVRVPLLLFNIAQAYRLKGDAFCKDAAGAYDQFLRDAPAGNESVPIAREQLTAMTACAEREAAAHPPPTLVVYPPAVNNAPPRRLGLRVLSPVLLAGGVALVAATGYFAHQSAAARDSIDSVCGPMCQWTDALNELEHTHATARTNAIAFGVVGGVALIAGSTLAYLAWRPIRR
jgi:tetratricopeptide (TPR) repeat protein